MNLSLREQKMIKKQLIEELKLTEQQLKQDVFVARHPKHEEVYFLILNKKANTFTSKFVRDIHRALDEVESVPGKVCLITTSLHPSIFSAGLDLNFLGPLEPADRANFILEFIRLLGRLLGFPIPTVALVNGHAIAGGCMLAFAHDWRFARAEAGKANFALNEIEIAMYLPPGMTAVVQQKVSPNVFRDMVLTAKRIDASTEGLQKGLVEATGTEAELLEKTIKFALTLAPYGVDKENHQKIKEEMNKTAINACLNQQLAAGVRGEYGMPKPRL